LEGGWCFGETTTAKIKRASQDRANTSLARSSAVGCALHTMARVFKRLRFRTLRAESARCHTKALEAEVVSRPTSTHLKPSRPFLLPCTSHAVPPKNGLQTSERFDAQHAFLQNAQNAKCTTYIFFVRLTFPETLGKTSLSRFKVECMGS